MSTRITVDGILIDAEDAATAQALLEAATSHREKMQQQQVHLLLAMGAAWMSRTDRILDTLEGRFKREDVRDDARHEQQIEESKARVAQDNISIKHSEVNLAQAEFDLAERKRHAAKEQEREDRLLKKSEALIEKGLNGLEEKIKLLPTD